MGKQMRRSQGQDRITSIWAAGWTGFDGRGAAQPRPRSAHARPLSDYTRCTGSSWHNWTYL